MDLINGLAARYCVRQDARGFIELWFLFVALAAALLAVLTSMRRGIEDRRGRQIAMVWCVTLASLIAVTGEFAWTIFRWCYESAAASLGAVMPNVARSVDTMVCLSPHAVEMIDNWLLIVVSCLAAVGLCVRAIFRLEGVGRRALSLGGAALALLFAAVNGGLLIFGVSWCHSSRLF